MAEAMSAHGSESPGERAHRACEKCTRTKKKCDKALPTCSRCTRLATTCCYDFVYTAPAMTIVEPAALAGYLLGSGSTGDHANAAAAAAAAATKHSIFEPGFDVPPSMIMALLGSRGISWRDSTDLYFQTMNPWLSVVHQERLAGKLEGLQRNEAPRSPVVALLIVCMHLVTQYADSGSPTMPVGDEMITQPAYIVAKRIFVLMRGLSEPSIELIQCAVLLCLYEFGHGDIRRAYVTIGDAFTMAKLTGLQPGKYAEAEKNDPVEPEQEEQRSLYWSIIVVDRLIHAESSLLWMPLHAPNPADDDLLPTTNIVWDIQTQGPVKTIQRHPANISPSVPQGTFQRHCQCAMLFAKALEWEADTYKANRPTSVESFSELDIATRALVEAMMWQTPRWGEYYESFATCTCLLLLLYCRYLRTIDSTNIRSSTSDVEIQKAIVGINFTVRIIADTTTDLNDHLSRRPDLLAPCSPVTPFSAYHCLLTLSCLDHVITDADARFHDIYSSLHFFAKRWGVAGKLVKRIESFLAEKDTSPDIMTLDRTRSLSFVI